MYERALSVIVKECARNPHMSFAVDRAAVRACGATRDVEHFLELMIPRCLLKQVVHGWWHVVRRERIDPSHSTLAIELESWP